MNLIWTNLALADYQRIVDFLIENWQIEVAQTFVSETNELLDGIKENPFMFKISNTKPYLRIAKITKHNALIYHIDDTEIVIIRIIDNRSKHLY